MFLFIKCQVIRRKIHKFWWMFWSFDVLWIDLSTHQNNMKRKNLKYKLSMFSLYRSIVFWNFFFMDFSTVLWHYMTICHGISRITGFYLRKDIHDICCRKKLFSFCTLPIAPLCIFGTHKDWPVILLVKVLVVRDICDLYFFWIWDAYFHITITGVIVTSGIANKHRTYFARNSM